MHKLYFTALLTVALACTNTPDKQPTGSNRADSTAAVASPEPRAPAATGLPGGKLVSTEDPLSGIEFKDGMFIETYDKAVLGTYTYTYDPGCANCTDAFEEGTGAGDAHKGCFSYTDAGETFCFIIYTHTDNEIEYSMIGGQGNTLHFIRR